MKKETPSPLKILIVGAGLGGLAAALCLARDGHKVHLYERRPNFEPKGGGIMIRPNASRFLIQWGLQSDFDAIADRSSGHEYIDAVTGKCFMKRASTTTSIDGYPDWGTFREDAQKLFYKRAVELGAKVVFNVTVTDVSEDPNAARVHLSTGEVVEGDLLLAADGILSRLRNKIIPDAPAPVAGWTTLYQVRATEDQLLADPEARPLASTECLRVWMRRGGGGYVVARCNKSLGRMSGAFGIPERDNDSRMWDENGDIEYVRNYFRDYSPIIKAFLNKTDRCDRWRLAEMPDLPQWISKHGRMALLGDSCHAMFPDAAMGFTSIIEDIGVLSHLLTHHARRGVPTLMKIWQDVRQPRVNKVKDWAKFNQTLYTKGTDAASPRTPEASKVIEVNLDDVQPDMNASYRSNAFIKWGFGFDAVADVERYIAGLDGGDDKMASARL